jgi:elongation factor P--(R)-beta-lysine ligase
MTDADWRPSASIESLLARARLVARARDFFAARGVTEVETPVLGSAPPTDPHIACLTLDTQIHGRERKFYLQSSPEYAMKRLLAAGSGPIYQICKAFRAGESGRHHMVEFTMLEWYRPEFDHHALMDEVADLVGEITGRYDVQRLSYAEAAGRHAGFDPHSIPNDELVRRVRDCTSLCAQDVASASRSDLLDLMFTHAIQPHLHGCVFISDFPACQAALARVDAQCPPIARRFELFIDGVEVANGYHELDDAVEQRRRMDADLVERARLGFGAVPIDEALISALEAGLGNVAGVAVGLDRLIALALGASALLEVVSFEPIGHD